jgi:DNA helicase II / ATP-dependent DNA helicase PcrA
VKTVKMFGPPGTGKTTALLDTMNRELSNGVLPERLAYLTFTVAARREAVDRAKTRFGYTSKQLPYFRTLHSIAFRELGLSRSCIVRDEIQDFSERVGMEISRVNSSENAYDMPVGGLPGDKLLAFDHFRRHNMLDVKTAYSTWREDMDWHVVKRFCAAYDAWKRREGLFDFTDLLGVDLEPLPVDVVLVDEAQDLSLLQWHALDIFAHNAQRVYIAGDDDQAIFTWAGASPQAFLDRRGKIVILNQSYRLPKRVHELSSTIISPIHNRQPKVFKPRDEEGDVSTVTEVDHIDFDREGSWLVLYRNHYLAGAIEERLRQLGKPYAKHDRVSPGAIWGPSIIAWERLRRGRRVTWTEVEHAYEGISASSGLLAPNAQRMLKRLDHEATYSIDDLVESVGLRTTAPWFESLTRIDESEIEYLRRVIQHHGSAALMAAPNITMSTIHAAKGAEADHVALLTDVSRKVRDQLYESPDDERRVFYVGVTRAKSTLTLVGVHNPLFN